MALLELTVVTLGVAKMEKAIGGQASITRALNTALVILFGEIAAMNKDNQESVIWSFGTTQIPTIAANFFEGIRVYNFVKFLDLLLKHEDVAVSEGIIICMFEKNFDAVEHEINPDDVFWQPFIGVRFSFRISQKDPLEYEIVDVPTFMSYLREACGKFLQQHPRYKDEVVEIFRANGLTY